MQSTVQTSTHAVSLVPTHGSQMMYATFLIILVMLAAQPLSQPPRPGETHGSSRGLSARDVEKPPPYTCDPALTALFTPARPELGRYEVCTTDQPLEGAAEALEALDAFGAAGPYDRAALQRLYGGTRVRVQRNWTASADKFVSTTRLSPYPDASLTRLHGGTMEVRWTLNR